MRNFLHIRDVFFVLPSHRNPSKEMFEVCSLSPFLATHGAPRHTWRASQVSVGAMPSAVAAMFHTWSSSMSDHKSLLFLHPGILGRGHKLMLANSWGIQRLCVWLESKEFKQNFLFTSKYFRKNPNKHLSKANDRFSS